MKNNFVNFEQAKKFKEKGFDDFCQYWYSNEGTLYHENEFNNSRGSVPTYKCYAPEQHTAIDWLFENYEIWIECFVDDNKTFGYLITIFSDEGRHDYPVKRNFSNKQEAYSNAFDFIFDNNLI